MSVEYVNRRKGEYCYCMLVNGFSSICTYISDIRNNEF